MAIKAYKKEMKNASAIIWIVLFACCFTSSVFATSYPSTGYGVVPPELSDPMLGATYNQDDLDSKPLGSGYGIAYYGVPFVAGDSITLFDNVSGTYITRILVPSNYLSGLFVVDWNNDGIWDSADEKEPAVGSGMEYYLLPVGDGNIILIVLISLYAVYILIKKNKNIRKPKFFLSLFKSKKIFNL